MRPAEELLERAGVQLAEPTLVMLHKRTEGWAAGLRLAALSLAGHPDPARFAAEFSGNERTVAEYLLAEVLDRQQCDRQHRDGAGRGAGGAHRRRAAHRLAPALHPLRPARVRHDRKRPR